MTNGQASAKCQLSPPASQPPSRAHSGNGLAVERVGQRRRLAPQAEVAIGHVDLKTARDHAEQQDRVEPVGQSHQAVVALDELGHHSIRCASSLPRGGPSPPPSRLHRERRSHDLAAGLGHAGREHHRPSLVHPNLRAPHHPVRADEPELVPVARGRGGKAVDHDVPAVGDVVGEDDQAAARVAHLDFGLQHPSRLPHDGQGVLQCRHPSLLPGQRALERAGPAAPGGPGSDGEEDRGRERSGGRDPPRSAAPLPVEHVLHDPPPKPGARRHRRQVPSAARRARRRSGRPPAGTPRTGRDGPRRSARRPPPGCG